MIVTLAGKQQESGKLIAKKFWYLEVFKLEENLSNFVRVQISRNLTYFQGNYIFWP